MKFNEYLRNIIETRDTLLCVGLDSVVEKLPDGFPQHIDSLLDFNKAVIDATLPFAAAFKVNVAFYEMYGAKGWGVLEKTLAYLPDDVVTIADAKRGDIGNTARMYAKAFYDNLGADAVTVNPYMGFDSVEPFLEEERRGVFLLCLTSNPGSADFQRISDGRQKVYEKIAEKANQWNSHQNCGLVVGATHPDELAGVRAIAPTLAFLIPGIGAQGGDLWHSVQNGTDEFASMALFNSSRAILYASSGSDFAEAAASVARHTRDKLQEARRHKRSKRELK